jgi:carbamoyltransferase
MKIKAAALNIHDHNTYDGVFHNQIERHNRVKHNLNPDNSHDPTPSREFFMDHVLPMYHDDDSLFAFTVSNLGQEFVIDLVEEHFGDKEFLKFYPNNLWDYYQTDKYYYIDHHQSHAVYAFLNSGYAESDILAIDGRGWQFNCIFVDKNGKITNLSDKLSIGGLWNRLAQDLGFGYLGAGKVMGLAGYGKYDHRVHALIEHYMHNADHKLPKFGRTVLERVSKEDVAYTLQYVTVELIKQHVLPLKSCNNICVAGGVAYNGYMNEELTKHYKNVHVPPAAGDEGQAIGAYMHADYIVNGNTHVPDVYSGRDLIMNLAPFVGLNYEILPFDKLAIYVADAIADGKIVGWMQGKSESGNRALGNRSILADPRNPDIKEIINSKIKLREDFRPFAPSVLEEHYKDYFDTNQPSPYMSRIMPVISDAIPGVTHVDGTARIQTVTREFNQRYYDLINEFYKLTGVPMLLNTSFNCQEPIVETAEDAVNTFNKCGLDMLVVGDILVRKSND